MRTDERNTAPAWSSARVDPTKATGSEVFQVPWDLAEIVDARQLAEWVREEIASLNWSHPDLVQHLKAHPNYHPRMMLTVLAYAYSSGVFESEEIIRRCDAESVYRGMCIEAAPESVSAIRKFRKDNRALLKWALVQVLKRCLGAKAAAPQGAIPAGVRRVLVENAVARLELARHLDRAMHEI